MLQLTGDWFDGLGSKKTVVDVTLDKNGLVTIVAQESGKLIYSLEQQKVTISSRLGNSPRYLNLPEGQSIETLDNDSVDKWIKSFRPGVFSGLVYRLESNLKFVALTLTAVVAIVWGTLQFGVPALSQGVANALPADLLDHASQETLAAFDKYFLQPSALSLERQQQLQTHFFEAINNHSELRIKVDFRHSDLMGPNAFALPNGQIIFTDEIVKLAAHDDELLAILAHEIGHVNYRHGLRRIVQNSLFVFLLALITGDTSGTSEIILGIPVLFTELAYSRSHETEADDYALQFLTSNNIPTHRFSDLMLRLEAALNEETEEKNGKNDSESSGIEWQRYLSTHPMTKERVKAFQ